MKCFKLLCIVFCLLWLLSCNKKQKPPAAADYRRAESFMRDSVRKKLYHLAVDPHWFDDSGGFAYRAHTRAGEKYYKVLLHGLKKEPAFDQRRLADSLENILGGKITAGNLPLEYISWLSKDQVIFSAKGKRYKMDLANYQIQQIQGRNRNFVRNGAVSPDGSKVVYIKNDDLFVRSRNGKDITRLSSGGSPFYIYGSYYGWGEVMTGEDQAPVPHLTTQWSPDSKKILTQIMDARKGEKMYLLNWAVDSLYRPVLLSYYRSSPGDSNDVKYIPVVFNVNTHKMVRIDLPPMPHYLGLNLHWTKDSRHLYGLYHHRGYKQLDVIEVDPATGKIRRVFTDSSRTYVEGTTQFRLLEEKGIALITSEKSGWNQLYSLNWHTGSVKPVTNGDYVVKRILSIDTAQKLIYFTASGKEKGVNPYDNLLYKINFDGSHLSLLTPDPVNHQVYLSPDKKYFVDNASAATRPTVSLLRSAATGKVLLKIDSADIKDLLAMGWHDPQVFTAKGRDGKTTIYGALWKPTDFNPHHHYPLIDYTYTGPQASVFPNTFSKGLYSFYSSAQSLAELGFIVMQVDGLGSAGRSKSFHDWSYKNMGNNLEDHVLAIKQLGRKYTWIDTSRVGIYGHSAGGYDAAHALMAFNNCYKVAVSESGDHDWRMEKAWWPEMYAGWPVDSVYQQQSNITMAPKLKGKLLLIHGGIDENVNPSATFKLCEALIKADKQFDLLIIPSSHHGYPAKYMPYVDKKRWNYFVKNLIVDPPR